MKRGSLDPDCSLERLQRATSRQPMTVSRYKTHKGVGIEMRYFAATFPTAHLHYGVEHFFMPCRGTQCS